MPLIINSQSIKQGGLNSSKAKYSVVIDYKELHKNVMNHDQYHTSNHRYHQRFISSLHLYFKAL